MHIRRAFGSCNIGVHDPLKMVLSQGRQVACRKTIVSD